MEGITRNSHLFDRKLFRKWTNEPALRNKIFSRYPKFLKKLLNSPSKEIQFLSKILISDTRSIIAKNIWYLNKLTKSDILRVDSFELKRQLPVKIIPENEIYRIRLLTSLLQVREAKTYQEFNMTKKMTQDLIDSLCKS